MKGLPAEPATDAFTGADAGHSRPKGCNCVAQLNEPAAADCRREADCLSGKAEQISRLATESSSPAQWISIDCVRLEPH